MPGSIPDICRRLFEGEKLEFCTSQILQGIKMIEFLETYGAENRLLKAVLFDLKVPEYIAGIKALGLISKFITGPLWSILEDKSVTIVDMNEIYHQLVIYLDSAVRDIDGFMTGQLVFDYRVVRDQFLECLTQPRPYDQVVETYLQVILSALTKLAKKLYADHLPGGKLRTNEIKTVAAPKTSCFAESVFGQMDHMLRTKPNISTLAAEASIMFANNNTLEWLQSKITKERSQVIKTASRNVPSMRRKYKERIDTIKEQRRIKLQEKIRKKEQAERDRIEKQENYTREIIIHGLWQSQAEIDQMLASYETNQQKIQALKTQLKFRRQVLCQVPENKSDFNITKSVGGQKRKNLTVEELTNNLKLLVQRAIVKDRESDEQVHMLVGKKIKHRFKETVVENGEKVDVLKWYTGKVISQVPWFREWFNVLYDNDPAVYTLRHLPTDLDREDLKIIV
ncbi:hypothetical protein MAR_016404 [Mya arenaria]|uniref:Uncharacterized protein n=1 Tax=Mya arenaria TaxID=6604 RepID=A0ABY7FJP7_MYAAR|nr:hypothetical protein MAR_016404 [Mya arenaria]